MMSRLLRAGVLAGGLLAAGAGVAHADETTGGQDGLLAGNQVLAPITVPITANGNGLDVLDLTGRHHHGSGGTGSAGSTGTATAPTSVPAVRTSGHRGLASGNQVLVPVQVPVTLGGDAIALLGRSDATGHHADSGAGSTGSGSTGSGATGSGSSTSGSGATTSGGDGVASGNQVVVPITAPVTVSGDAVSVLGDSTISGAGDSSTGASSGSSQPAAGTAAGGGVGSGNQVLIPVCAPVNANGDAVSVLGGANGRGASSGCGTLPAVASVTPTDPTSPTGPTGSTGSTGPTTPTGPSAPGTPSTPATGASGATPGAAVLGLHLVRTAADAAPTTGSLAMTGARPILLIAAGIITILTGLVVRRSMKRERDF